MIDTHRRIAAEVGRIELLVAVVLTVAVVDVGCGGGSNTQPQPATSNSPIADTSSGTENLSVLPADDAVIQQAANDLHAKIVGAKAAGTLTLESGKPLSIGLIAARDDESFSDKNYAAYIAGRLLETLSQFNDAPYEIVALDVERQALVNKRLEEQGDNYDFAQIANSLGEQLPTNLGLFVEIRAKSETAEELSTKLYQVGRGTLVIGKSYSFDSPYLKFLSAGQKAEQAGDASEAEQYYTLAVEARRGADPRAARLQQQSRAKLPPAELQRRKDNEVLIRQAREQINTAQMLWNRNRPGDRDKVKRLMNEARENLSQAQRKQPNNKVLAQMLQDLEALIRKYQRLSGKPH